MGASNCFVRLLYPSRLVLELSILKFYLAKAILDPYLAVLPDSLEFDQKRRAFTGVLGAKTRNLAEMTEHPHRVFVNWPSTKEGIERFTLGYGLLDPTGKNSQWLFGINERSKQFAFRLNAWRECQHYFQEYWDCNKKHSTWDVVRHDLTTELMGVKVIGGPALSHPGIEVSDLRKLGKDLTIVLEASSLWQYLCALLAFHEIGELRTCQNLDCPAPRFIAKRKDQVFCSADCAALITKRRWWERHGEKWRQGRKLSNRNGGKR